MFMLLTAFALIAEEPKVEYRGKAVTVTKFVSLCKSTPLKQLANSKASAKLEGFGVLVEGVVKEIEKGKWAVRLGEVSGKEFVVDVAAEKLKNTAKVRPGVRVRVAGIWNADRKLDGLAWELTPPGLKWEYELERPSANQGGFYQTFTVVVKVKNTGTQPLKNVVARVRLWQTDTPNDSIEQISIAELDVGQTKRVEVRFVNLNFQHLGGSSTPKCAATVVDYDI